MAIEKVWIPILFSIVSIGCGVGVVLFWDDILRLGFGGLIALIGGAAGLFLNSEPAPRDSGINKPRRRSNNRTPTPNPKRPRRRRR